MVSPRDIKIQIENSRQKSSHNELVSSYLFSNLERRENRSCMNKLKSWISNSSLCCINKESKLRQTLLILLTEKESLIPKESFEKSPELYGIDLTSIVQNFSEMEIFDGKLVVK